MSKLIALVLLVSAVFEPCHAQTYSLHDLGDVQGGDASAWAMSSNGKAAGYVRFNIYGQERPALFELGQLPTPIYTDGPGRASGVNASGEVVGWYREGWHTVAFRWKHNVLTTLTPLGVGDSVATAINNRGEAVGWSTIGPGVTHAFRHHKGTMTDLGDWGGIAAQATAINENGDIAGFREVVVDGAVVREGVRVIKGTVEVLNSLIGATNVVPLSINERGDVAGYMYASPTANPFEVQAFAVIKNQPKFLGKAFPNSQYASGARSINASGEVAGFRFDGNADPRDLGYMWQKNGEALCLHCLPEVEAARWSLGAANAIGNDGVIVGETIDYNLSRLRAYMLVPTSKRP